VVVEVFVTQRQAHNALANQSPQRVFEALRVAVVGEAGGGPGDDAEAPLDGAQQQHTAIRSKVPAIKPRLNFTRADGVEIERGLNTLCHDKAAPVCGPKPVLDKQFVPQTAALFNYFGEKCGLARHCTPQLTLNVYAKVRPERMRATVESIGSLLPESSGNGAEKKA
jgi:hypothetical protein